MNKLLLLLVLSLIPVLVFGQASNPNNTFKIGKKSDSVDKGIIFDTNDGANNQSIKVEAVSKMMKLSPNKVQVGDGASVNNKDLVLDATSGAGLKWNGSTSKIEFSNDGAAYTELGGGGGVVTPSIIRLNNSGNLGNGSTNSAISRFETVVTNTGNITYVSNATLGASFTIVTAGTYHITYSDAFDSVRYIGLSLNSTQLATDIYSITQAHILTTSITTGTSSMVSVSWSGYLEVGDIIRPHHENANRSASSTATFTISN